MLSYRHSFHAGNFADLLKHIVQIEVLDYLTGKDKPFTYIDTHAGAGFYRLEAAPALKNKEYLNGVGHWFGKRVDRKLGLDAYLKQVAQHNPGGKLRFYPGSPAIAEGFLRPADKAWLFELHPRDHDLLSERFQHRRQVKVRQEDGYQGLLALLPCPSGRALALLDPSYELKTDYERAVDTVIKAHRKMSHAVFVLWYPVVERARIERMQQRLKASGIRRIQQFELGLQADTEGRGMTSAGLFVINPPWTLFDKMERLLPELAATVSTDGAPHYRCETLVGE